MIITDAKYGSTCAASCYQQWAIRGKGCLREACQMRFQAEIPLANCLGLSAVKAAVDESSGEGLGET